MGSIGLPHRGGSIITHRLHVGNLVGTSEVLHYLCLMRHALAYMSRGSCLQSACRKAIFTYFVFQIELIDTLPNKLILGNDNFLAQYNWVRTWSDNWKIMIIPAGLMAPHG